MEIFGFLFLGWLILMLILQGIGWLIEKFEKPADSSSDLTNNGQGGEQGGGGCGCGGCK